MTQQTFQNKVAIVTGAGEGIGYEIARQLALYGASVLLNDVDENRAQNAALQITSEGGICRGTGGDVGNIETVRGLVSQAVEAFGRLDIAVANAGLTFWGSFLDYTPEAFYRVVNVNLAGSFFLAQAAARQMRDQGDGGRILLMSSVTGHQAVKYLSAYGMTKAGIEMLARNLVIELSPYGITINAIAPGATLTPRNLKNEPDYAETWGQVTPTGRVGEPIDIAEAALFLLSPQARQITGQTIVVDGGWTAVSPSTSLDFVEKK
jgi:3-oxoacyl-[acyl-carrier protein] reductase